MKNLRIILSLGLVLIFLSGKAQSIVQEKSYVSFEISNMKINTVKGSFRGMTGTINFNESDLPNSSFNVCLDASTVDTDSKKRDKHLKTEDFFHIDKYPTICFVSESIEKGEKGYIVKGNLNMHGMTRVIEIPFVFGEGTFTGNIRLNRFDYNVGQDTGTFMVGEAVELKIVCGVE